MNTVRRVWHGRLMPMPRPRVNRRGGVGQSRRYRAHIAALREYFADLPRPRVGEGVAVLIVVRKRVSAVSRSFGDVDNLAKTVLDALPFDDVVVVALEVRKVCSVVDSVEVHVRYGLGIT